MIFFSTNSGVASGITGAAPEKVYIQAGTVDVTLKKVYMQTGMVGTARIRCICRQIEIVDET